ncbi:nucleotidyltransferase domain-containing protein [Streptomyces sp. NBC_00147]
MIDRLEQGGWPLNLVEEIYVFGSYARGALEPGDVDLVHPTHHRPAVAPALPQRPH